jgi:hypothetical protein
MSCIGVADENDIAHMNGPILGSWTNIRSGIKWIPFDPKNAAEMPKKRLGGE